MKYKKNLKYLLIIGLEFLTELFAAAFDGILGALLQGAAIITFEGEVLPPQPVLCCHGCRKRYSKIQPVNALPLMENGWCVSFPISPVAPTTS